MEIDSRNPLSTRPDRLVLVSTAVLTISTSATVSATDHVPPPDPGTPEGPEWPPPDSEGQWLPAPDDLAQTFPVTACDSTVTVSPGDVFDVEYHAMHQPDGTIRIEYRGVSTVDLVRESDGAMLDGLDVSGPGTSSSAQAD